ncbi:hypothetical protein, partial [Pseudomonas poae]|uniref:hypothetical protein n=1 Tax=Pseudomonas poae TaxID=200451 RepID=UPI001F30C6A3
LIAITPVTIFIVALLLDGPKHCPNNLISQRHYSALLRQGLGGPYFKLAKKYFVAMANPVSLLNKNIFF